MKYLFSMISTANQAMVSNWRKWIADKAMISVWSTSLKRDFNVSVSWISLCVNSVLLDPDHRRDSSWKIIFESIQSHIFPQRISIAFDEPWTEMECKGIGPSLILLFHFAHYMSQELPLEMLASLILNLWICACSTHWIRTETLRVKERCILVPVPIIEWH